MISRACGNPADRKVWANTADQDFTAFQWHYSRVKHFYPGVSQGIRKIFTVLFV